jgi:hypothetical protein
MYIDSQHIYLLGIFLFMCDIEKMTEKVDTPIIQKIISLQPILST